VCGPLERGSNNTGIVPKVFILTAVNIIIKPLSAADQEFLAEILYQALYLPEGAKPFPRSIMHQPNLARYIQGWGNKDDMGFLAIDTETKQKTGAVWSRLFDINDKGYGYVDDHTPELSIALLPEYRGHGIGSRLLQRFLEAAEKKYRAISLSVSKANRAVRLYSRFGFATVEQTADSLTMLKKFKSVPDDGIPDRIVVQPK
jgi:GNAT superfamily N-acetyltransferase